jgi:hypothetical protein
VYYGEGSYQSKSPYDAVFTISFLWEGTAYLHAAHGKTNPHVYSLIAKTLMTEYGVKTILMERHGKLNSYPISRFVLKE